MTPYRVILREAAAAVLLNAGTMAGQKIYTARSLPSTIEDLPNVYLQVPIDQGTSLGRSQPGFRRVAYLQIEGRVTGGTPGKVEDTLDLLAGQIEYALMQDASFQAQIQQVTEIDTRISIDSSGSRHLGVVTIRMGLEFDEYYQANGPALTEITGTMTANGNTDFAGMQVPTT
ncbi:hypothetical protein CFR75_06085 [Komagataeibacter xylinus]|uniref:Uncharacterized protein n=2 Tax=Komagataeibacter xylinus TaxID=28448 RepID=A0A318Q3W4_KOMXY|nr:hypothetical protein [Komagataeibacter xylinus]PYD57385.1 hypothetical protein CFR75_06085 [Komagataeibacter xylinus]GBQ80659.1 hypothetical protein AA15237_3039 [Komagataeibacter xylinus NBRC 15237]